MIQRLPKGHSVIYAYALGDDEKEYLRKKKVDFTEDDTKIFVECIVSGDEPGKGLSIVAVSNPLHCVYQDRSPHPDANYWPHEREEAISGYMKSPSLSGIGFGAASLHCLY